MSTRINVTVNGIQYNHLVEPRLLLVSYLREVLRLTGTHVGCDTSNCGACTILVNGKATKCCTLLAVQADGCEIITIEGLSHNGELAPAAGRRSMNATVCNAVLYTWHDHDGGRSAATQSATNVERIDSPCTGRQTCRCTGYQEYCEIRSICS